MNIMFFGASRFGGSTTVNSGDYSNRLYLVVLPFQGEVDEIYSADEHFKHQDFTALASVKNPISEWVLIEGRRPQRKTQIAQILFIPTLMGVEP